MHRDQRIRLASEEYRIRQRRKLNRLTLKRLAAEENQRQQEHTEIVLLIRAADNGLSHTALDPQDALFLARAARNVVSAEHQTAHLRVKECRLLLETLEAAAEQAQATWYDAIDQVSTILAVFHHHGVPINLPYPLLVPPPTDSDSDSSVHSEIDLVDTDETSDA